ncbi:hypothetical protein P691DRAFT_768978 [Macrolepiota fuliginosa MF-IS2]|uniref:Uncharacterized protein n=1 Tax=Macrolepiota fuliginosa MF-IS2 TaxID=1400762 RepID=A0A9P6BVU8_9AGAR|nr:hypothetical protein P691DRAFT_768978 [Macrolepiota fuliginosa MF-IS2]
MYSTYAIQFSLYSHSILSNNQLTLTNLDDLNVVLLDSEECPNRIWLVAGSSASGAELTGISTSKDAECRPEVSSEWEVIKGAVK